MKSVLLISLLLITTWGSLTRIRDRNAAVRKAATAYSHGDFAGATRAYRQAVEAFGAQDESILLNLAHASARAGDAGIAKQYYNQLSTSKVPSTRSIAQQQLAVLAAQHGDYVQAISLSRRALQTDPGNATARYNYEVLRNYLTRHPNQPQVPPPAPPPGAPDKERQPGDEPNQPAQPRPKAGTDHQGQLNDPARPADQRNAPQRQPNAQGQPDPNRPDETPGNAAKGSFKPGSGPERNVARGTEPGSVRGLSDAEQGPEAPSGTSRRAGTDPADLDETQLQTQRARLQQMNISPGQARQLLNALGAAEEQYIQQLPHRAAARPAGGKPAW